MFSKRESRYSCYYVMAKPPAVLAGTIGAMPRACGYEAARMHVTLVRLGGSLPRAVLPWLARRLEELDIPPFRLVFDRIVSSDHVVALTGTEALRGAMRAQKAIVRMLSAKGVPTYGPDPFWPHLTISYRPDGRGTEAIDPISWRVDEILLVESVVGEGRHVEHGRFPLRAPALAA